MKRRKEIVQEITRNVANVFSFYAIIAIEYGLGLGFQHLSRDLANVNAWKTMFDPYVVTLSKEAQLSGTNKISAQELVICLED